MPTATRTITIRMEEDVYQRIVALASTTKIDGALGDGRSIVTRRLLEAALLMAECIGWDGLNERVEDSKDLAEARRRE